MMANERQQRIAQAQLRRFEEALAVSGRGADVAPRIVQAMGDAITSERDELCSQLARYEALRAGRVTQRGLCSRRELPAVMIEGRIAARITRQELAKRLGIPEQQVQGWEINGCLGAGLGRLQEIADALGSRCTGPRPMTCRTAGGTLAGTVNQERLTVADETYLTPAQVADELQVTVVTVPRWIANRELRATKVGPRRWMIRRSDLNGFLTEGGQSDARVEVSEDSSFSKHLVAPDDR